MSASKAGTTSTLRPGRQVMTSAGAVVSAPHSMGLLTDGCVTLRRLHEDDADSLVSHLGKPRIHHHIAAPPATAEGFRHYVRWTRRQQHRYKCWGIVPEHGKRPVGIIQLWSLRSRFEVAEWGFLLDDAYWGTGLFVQSAQLVMTHAFSTLGVSRLEARASAENERGNGVLRKLGAVMECVLRQSTFCNGHYVDYHLWSLLPEEGCGAGLTVRPVKSSGRRSRAWAVVDLPDSSTRVPRDIGR